MKLTISKARYPPWKTKLMNFKELVYTLSLITAVAPIQNEEFSRPTYGGHYYGGSPMKQSFYGGSNNFMY